MSFNLNEFVGKLPLPVPEVTPTINNSLEQAIAQAQNAQAPLSFKPYSLDDEFYVFDFIGKYAGTLICDGLNEAHCRDKAKKIMALDLSRVLRSVTRGDHTIYGKISKTQGSTEMKINKFGEYGGYSIWIKWVDDKGKDKLKSLPIFTFLIGDKGFASESIDSIPYHKEVFEWNDDYSSARIVPVEQKDDRRIFNIFPGFRAKLIPIGDRTPTEHASYCASKCRLLLEHIAHIWAYNNKHLYKYILSWFQQPLKYLKKTEIMMVLLGDEGCGKSIIFDFLRDFLTGPAITGCVALLDEITGKYNPLMANKMFMLIDESANKGENIGKVRYDTERMKHYITGSVITIEEKFKTALELTNNTSFALASNNEQPVSISPLDRRHFINKCNNQHLGNREYFKTLSEHLNQECADAFYTYLQLCNWDINILDIPQTEARLNCIKASKAVGSAFFEDVVSGAHPLPWNKIVSIDGLPAIKKDDFYESFKKWHEKTNNGLKWSDNNFCKEAKACKYFLHKPDYRGMVSGKKGERGTYYIFLSEHCTDIKIFLDKGQTTQSIGEFVNKGFGLLSTTPISTTDNTPL